MGGTGKTTLAKNVYENSLVMYHFDVRVWVTVSQEYSATHMLSQALSCIGESRNKTDDELGTELHKSLFGRRYMIVLDDVWSVEAWEKIQNFFPENGNGSRIVVTTRQQEVVNYFGSSSLAVEFRDYKNSWDLFCEVTFSEQKCPPQLAEIAEKIVRKCKGLPLAIHVIGGLLGKGPRSQEHWEEIARDKNLVMEYSDDGNKPYNILYMSYKYLPVWLRSCFLYLGLFPEDHKIDVFHLTKLWVAEGFIKPIQNQSLEQVAESYIIDLVDRNLLLVGALTEYKKVSYYCLHDLVRELCIKTAEKENFFCVQKDIGERRQYIFDERSASVYPVESLTSKKPSIIKPLILSWQREAPFKSRLLRLVVDDNESSLHSSFQQINLRYISHLYSQSRLPIPCSISLCWSLQTLIVKTTSPVVVPSEIWKMPQLRHIKTYSMYIDDPPPDDFFILPNLQTLARARNLIFSEEVCARIPNIVELEIVYRFSEEQVEQGWCFHLDNIEHFSKLKSLICCCGGEPYADDPLKNLKLPGSLMELTLEDCNITWSGMTMIASLPNLQLLKLRGKAVVGSTWNFVEEKFISLKYLMLYKCHNLVSWVADSFNFPVLETLYLCNLWELREIPLDIGEICTLEKITVYNCLESASMSAIKILQEQQHHGNQSLQISIHPAEGETWKKKIKECYTSPNLHIL